MPISPKQVALLLARFSEAGIFSGRDRLDYLYELGINVSQDRKGEPEYEQMTHNQLDKALGALKS